MKVDYKMQQSKEQTEEQTKKQTKKQLFCKKAQTWVKTLLFPGFLLFVEIIFFIIYGLLVEYDEGGLPGQEYEVALSLANTSNGINVQSAQDYLLRLQSTRSTTKVYPCK